MKDMHCHLLPGIDDGCRSFDESISILKQAEKEGVTDIILTPHYIEDTNYNSNNEKKEKIFKKLKLRTKKEKININLYLGNEILINRKINELIEKKEILTLNNTKYILVEFSFLNMLNDNKNILYDLTLKGYEVILAHPERYEVFQKNPMLIEKYLELGILLQGNYKSLFNKYGRKSKQTLKFFLKKGWVSFLASDIHHFEKYNIKKLTKKLNRLVGKKETENLLCTNFDKLISNTKIENNYLN